MKKKTTSLGMKLVAFLAMLMLFCIPVSAGVKETAGEYEIDLPDTAGDHLR